MAIVCVGAVYIDIILTVPHFPIEDQKLRASSHTRRRGGNCPNTLEVLAQLADIVELQNGLNLRDGDNYPLFLISVLPNKDSAAVKYIRDSLPKVSLDPTCIYRPDHSEAASSYVINNQQNGSRTIVSHHPLAEMTYQNFLQKAMTLRVEGVEEGWFHFEVSPQHPSIAELASEILALYTSGCLYYRTLWDTYSL
jgi:ketohexokinase